MTPHSLGVAGVLFAALVWGTTGVAATFAPDVSAVAIGAAAMGIGGLLQCLYAAQGIRRNMAKLRMQWRYLLLGGIAVAIYPLAFYGAMRLAGVTIGNVVTIGSAPLIAAVIELVFDKTKLSTRWMIGAAIGLVGIVLISMAKGHDLGGGAQDTAFQGVLLGLIGGATYALYSWTARRVMLSGVRSDIAMGATFGIGSLLLLPVLLATGAPLLASWGNAFVGLYLAVIPMFLGYLSFGYGLARVSASTATTTSLFEPVVAACLAVLIVAERLSVTGWIGVALVVTSLCVITVKRKPLI